MSREHVRVLIRDTDAAKRMFADSEIDTFLALEGQSVYRAAALACMAIAADKARLGKFTLEGYADNEAAAASLFLQLAETYREAAAVDLTAPSWAIVEWPR